MNKKKYYISNMTIKKSPEEIMEYGSGTAGSVRRQLSKIFYFSNKIDMNEAFAFQGEKIMTWEKHKITQNSGLLRNGLSKSDRDRTDRNKRKRSKPDILTETYCFNYCI